MTYSFNTHKATIANGAVKTNTIEPIQKAIKQDMDISADIHVCIPNKYRINCLDASMIFIQSYQFY